MNVLQRWAEEQLTRVPTGPAPGELRRRVRARRARRASALAAVAIVVAVLGIAATLHSPSSHHVLVTGPPPIASSTTVPQSTRPLATTTEFPPLGKIIGSVTGSVESNGDPKAVLTNPDSAEIVATTDAKAYALWGGAQDDKPIYVVQVAGKFACDSCRGVHGAALPRGHALQVFFDTSGNTMGFGITPKPRDLTKLGTVYRLALPG